MSAVKRKSFSDKNIASHAGDVSVLLSFPHNQCTIITLIAFWFSISQHLLLLSLNDVFSL